MAGLVPAIDEHGLESMIAAIRRWSDLYKRSPCEVVFLGGRDKPGHDVGVGHSN